MRICPNCEKEISEHSIICRFCGNTINNNLRNDSIKKSKNEDQELQKECPFCHEVISNKSIICRYCGRNVRELPGSKVIRNSEHQSNETSEIKGPKPKSLFLRALLSSFVLSGLAFSASLASQSKNMVFGIEGYINNTLLSLLTNIVIYFIASYIVLKIRPNYSIGSVVGTIFVILVVIYLGSRIISNLDSQSTKSTATSIPTLQKTPTKVPTQFIQMPKSQNPTIDGKECKEWKDVSVVDGDREICVFGTVRSSYFSETYTANIIIFSSDPEAFYLIMHGDLWYPNIEGICVIAKGKIRTVYNTPYIELKSENFYECN